jgi:hypothetical protein
MAAIDRNRAPLPEPELNTGPEGRFWFVALPRSRPRPTVLHVQDESLRHVSPALAAPDRALRRRLYRGFLSSWEGRIFYSVFGSPATPTHVKRVFDRLATLRAWPHEARLTKQETDPTSNSAAGVRDYCPGSGGRRRSDSRVEPIAEDRWCQAVAANSTRMRCGFGSNNATTRRCCGALRMEGRRYAAGFQRQNALASRAGTGGTTVREPAYAEGCGAAPGICRRVRRPIPSPSKVLGPQ